MAKSRTVTRIDAQVFPRLAAHFRQHGYPSWAHIDRPRRWYARVELDSFFVQPEVQWQLTHFYDEYLQDIFHPAWRHHRKPTEIIVPMFHDWVGLTCLTEHVDWWAGLFDGCAEWLVPPPWRWP